MGRRESEIKHFSKLDHIWWGALSSAGQARYDHKFLKLREYCDLRQAKNILEIGCGDGEFTKRLIKLKSVKILGTDLTPAVVAKAKADFKGKQVKFKVEDSERMKIRDSQYDLVCGISILHHLNIKKCLQECKRVLKDNGEIFFTEPNLRNPIIYAGLSIPFLRKRMEFSPDETALVRTSVASLLKEIGFSDYKVANYDFLYPSTPEIFIRPVRSLSDAFEKLPFVREFSGSLIIWARK